MCESDADCPGPGGNHGAAACTHCDRTLHRCSASPASRGAEGAGALSLERTIHDCAGHAGCAGLHYVVQARAYPSSPLDVVTTMRGGGVALWRWDEASPTQPFALRDVALHHIPTEGQDSLGDLLVVVALNRGVYTLDYPSMRVRGSANISVSGALHCKLWRQGERTFALITTGLTDVTADRDYLVAVEVTDRDQPKEVARLNTPVRDTEGVLVLGTFAYVGGYVSPNTFVSVDLRGLTASPPALRLHSTIGPRPEYDNMVGALANSSFRDDGVGASKASNPPCNGRCMYFGSYNRPGGLLAFEAQEDGTLGEPFGKLLTQETARTNRVHIHPSSKYALLALEKGVAGTDTPPAGETGGIAVVDIQHTTAMRVVGRAASPERGGRVYTATWSPSGTRLVSFSAQNASAFVYSFAAPLKLDDEQSLGCPLPAGFGSGRRRVPLPSSAAAGTSRATADGTETNDTLSEGALRATRSCTALSGGGAWQTLHFAHTGGPSAAPSPVLHDVDVLDVAVPGRFELFYSIGSSNNPTDFAPRRIPLTPGSSLTFAPFGGRSSDQVLPMFHFISHDSAVQSLWVGVGWTGTYRLELAPTESGVRVRVGQNTTALSLLPGEGIRTPSVVTLRYSGDEAAGFNRWRRLMREHFSPRQHGSLEPVVLPTAANFASIPFEDCNETNQVLAIRNAARYLKPAGVDTCKPPRYRCHLGCILLNRR